jgi:hypothetical protein
MGDLVRPCWLERRAMALSERCLFADLGEIPIHDSRTLGDHLGAAKHRDGRGDRCSWSRPVHHPARTAYPTLSANNGP